MGRIAALALMLTVLPASCQTLGLTSSFCDPRTGIGPVQLNPEARAALPRSAKENILRINGYGRDNCGWRA